MFASRFCCLFCYISQGSAPVSFPFPFKSCNAGHCRCVVDRGTRMSLGGHEMRCAHSCLGCSVRYVRVTRRELEDRCAGWRTTAEFAACLSESRAMHASSGPCGMAHDHGMHIIMYARTNQGPLFIISKYMFVE